jgi:putative DNA methylase
MPRNTGPPPYNDDTQRLAEGGLGPVAYADAVATYLGLALSKLAVTQSSVGIWSASMEQSIGAFGRQAIVMTWDFPEANAFNGMAGDIQTSLNNMMRVIDQADPAVNSQVDSCSAASIELPLGACVSTDPPYYDNIAYADLSDFAYVWLRKVLSSVHPSLFRRVLTPKSEELVATPYRHGGKEEAESFFMEGMKTVLARISKSINQTPAAIFYAFKQSEAKTDGITSAGWASFLQAVTDNGLAVDGTWPIRTERDQGLKTGSNVLASSIVLVCRRRDVSAPTITRADYLRALRREMPAALAEIRRAGVGPTDIQQAAIGPGIGIFSRNSQVLNTDGTPMLVRDALKLINQVHEEVASTTDADYDSETRFALDWFAAKGFEKGRAGDAIVMTNAVDVSLDGMNAAGFFLADGGVARLLKREELPDDWDPAGDNRATVWEACQHLIKRLRAEDGGIDAAAALYNRLGSRAEPAHALARRLYDICEQKQWATEGYVYNQLHQEWDTIEKRATALAEAGQPQDLFSR